MTSYLALIQPNFSEKINHLRAFAALWIFVFHYYHFIAHTFFTPLKSVNPFLLLVYHGYFCVYLFFLLSGYLLIKAYPEKLDLKSYLFKRLGRIFPAYYLCIAVYCLVFTTGWPSLKLFITIFSTDLGSYPATLGHLWFINRLLDCYLLFPLLWWVANKTGQIGLLLTYLLCLLGGGSSVIYFKTTLPDYYFSFVLCLSYMIVGMLTANLAEKSNPLLSIIVTLILFFSTLEWLHQSTWQAPLDYSWLSILWLNVIALLFVVLIRTYLFLPLYLPQFFSVLMQKLGNLSYTFYLYHFLVIQYFIRHPELLSTTSWVNFIALFLLCTFIAIFFQQLLAVFFRMILAIRNITTASLK